MTRTAPVIELVGAPGAGKTTFLPLVAEALEGLGARPLLLPEAGREAARRTLAGRLARAVLGRHDRRFAWILFTVMRMTLGTIALAVDPPIARNLWASQRRRPAGADARRRRVVSWFVRTVGSRQVLLRTAAPDEVVLLDEGLVHRVVQLHASPVERPTEREVRAYLDLVPRPDLIVYVNAGVSCCQQRVERRGRWQRLAHRSDDDVAEFIANAHQGVELAMSDARERGWAVLEIDNGIDEPPNRDQLRAAIARSLRRTEHRS